MSDQDYRDRDKELRKGEGSSIRPGQWIGLIALALFIIFVVQNTNDGSMEVLFWELTLPVWVFFVGVFLLGAVFGWFAKGRRAKRG